MTRWNPFHSILDWLKLELWSVVTNTLLLNLFSKQAVVLEFSKLFKYMVCFLGILKSIIPICISSLVYEICFD